MYVSKDKIDIIFQNLEISPNYYEHRNQLTALVQKSNLVDFFSMLKRNENTSFDMCIDITAIDWMKKGERFEVVYILYSTKFEHYLHVKTQILENDLHCPSATSIWASANWYERETYDMYGIIFDNHPFLRRFYMTEDFRDPETKEPIYPLRKDIPLMGIPGALPLPQYPEKFGELK